jgi:hypothetical protein
VRTSVVIFPISGRIFDIAEGSSDMAKPSAALRDIIGAVGRSTRRRLTVPGAALNSSPREDKIAALIQRVHEPTRWPDGKLLVLEDNRTLLDTARRVAITWEERPPARVVLFIGSMSDLSAVSDAPLLLNRGLAAFDGLPDGVKVMASDGSVLHLDHASYDEKSGKIIHLPGA